MLWGCGVGCDEWSRGRCRRETYGARDEGVGGGGGDGGVGWVGGRDGGCARAVCAIRFDAGCVCVCVMMILNDDDDDASRISTRVGARGFVGVGGWVGVRGARDAVDGDLDARRSTLDVRRSTLESSNLGTGRSCDSISFDSFVRFAVTDARAIGGDDVSRTRGPPEGPPAVLSTTTHRWTRVSNDVERASPTNDVFSILTTAPTDRRRRSIDDRVIHNPTRSVSPIRGVGSRPVISPVAPFHSATRASIPSRSASQSPTSPLARAMHNNVIPSAISSSLSVNSKSVISL